MSEWKTYIINVLNVKEAQFFVSVVQFGNPLPPFVIAALLQFRLQFRNGFRHGRLRHGSSHTNLNFVLIANGVLAFTLENQAFIIEPEIE